MSSLPVQTRRCRPERWPCRTGRWSGGRCAGEAPLPECRGDAGSRVQDLAESLDRPEKFFGANFSDQSDV